LRYARRVIQIRGALPDDHAAYVRLFAELGVDDPIPGHDRYVAELMARMRIAVKDGAVVGFTLADQMRGVGYLRNIVSAPDVRRTGVGVALVVDALARFRDAGATRWCLNVKPDNAAAIGLYQRFGLRPAFRTHVLRLPSTVALPPPPSDLVLAPVPAERDAEIEPRFGLVPGHLASARARPSRFVLGLARGEDVLGVCVMMPSVPGAFPFRVVEPGHAAAFMARLRAAHVPATAAFLQVSAEGDDALAAEVQRLGAYVNHEILHMEGPVEAAE
jgi:GNAT superfamily N-acetyltransferase